MQRGYQLGHTPLDKELLALFLIVATVRDTSVDERSIASRLVWPNLDAVPPKLPQSRVYPFF